MPYYYAVSMTGHETYSTCILATEQEIPNFGKQAEILLNEVLLETNSEEILSDLNYSIHEKIAAKLISIFGGHIVVFKDEYYINEFLVHNISYPANVIAEHEILGRPFWNGKPPEPFFPDFVSTENRQVIFQKFLDLYRKSVTEWSKEPDFVNIWASDYAKEHGLGEDAKNV